MAFSGTELRRRAAAILFHPRARRLLIWCVAILAAPGLLSLAAPWLLRDRIAAELSSRLHRRVTIEQIRLNPYALSVTIRGLAVRDRQDQTTALSVSEAYVNLESLSLFYRGPVIKELRVVGPYLHLIRNEDRTYNFTDLIREFTQGPPGPPPRFSLNNVEIVDGRIELDDLPEGVKHEVTALKLGVPFVSSLPYYADIKVRPVFSAIVNGAPVKIEAETRPFGASRESTIHLDIDNLQPAKYLEYSPVDLDFGVPAGRIDGRLTVSFRSPRGKPAALVLSGRLDFQDFAVRGKDGAPILTLPKLEVAIDAIEVFARKAALKAVRASAPELHVIRFPDGRLNLAALLPRSEAPAEKGETAKKEEPAPFRYSVEELAVERGTVHLADRRPKLPFETTIQNIRLDVKGLTSGAERKARTELSFQTAAGEQLAHKGSLQLDPLAADGTLAVTGLRLPALRPYYGDFAAIVIEQGLLDVAGRFAVVLKGGALDARVSDLEATLRSLRVEAPGESEPLWRIPLLSIKDVAADLGAKSLVIGSVESRDGNVFFWREADGTAGYPRLLKTAAGAGPSAAGPRGDAAAWKVETKSVALDAMRLIFEDRSITPRSRLVVSDLALRAQNLSTARNARAQAAVRAKINERGGLRLAGSATIDPLNARFAVEAEGIGLLPLQPYLNDRANFVLTGGRLGTKGTLSVEAGGNGSARLSYAGDVRVVDFGSVEKDSSRDLVRWGSLGLNRLRFSLEPLEFRVEEIDLADFYARLIIGADGRTNLQKLAAREEASGAAPEPMPQAGRKRVTIGRIGLKSGTVNFSDFFIKPNYSANLTGVEGTISELTPEVPGNLELRASLDDSASVDIRGRINPLAESLYLDIAADAREIELSPLSPYSGKYVGYGIEKGKLSFKVKYRLENRKLTAENQLILNQLTFGERIESPTATKLPVLLAVALLKDRNGVIDVDLPIAGSLDDPQFSVGGIILRIVINIVAKAVTAPFALLGAAFGGGGEELSVIEFDYGRADLSPTARSRLKTIATALNNRPALRLEIAARFDPMNDLEGLKRVALERKVRIQKLRDLAGREGAPKSADEVRVDPKEYPLYLKAAYAREDFPKPRNLIGLARDLPVPEMEALMLKHERVSGDDLPDLAARRARAIRDYLLGTGQVTPDRLFTVAPRPAPAEPGAEARGSRVEFTLR
ncbi:MAG TPA: DUF748 domain-containing protein [candidate division Zixibacteria bacterium]|nr:DUF748 domain-containing protein [candidate division Zixibacteria bacterium]